MKQILLFFVSYLIVQTSLGQNLPLLKISSDNNYIVTHDNEPFFWLGGTAWELIHRLDKEEIDKYLTDRASKGFTVIQTVILAELDGLNTPNAYREKPLINNDPTKLNERYFTLVDYVLEKANELGLYIALLPSWGDKFNKKWGTGPEIFNTENARIYGEILAKRYIKYNNLIWILGGDRPLESENHFEIIRAMALGIREVDKNHLISFHPVGAKKATDFLNDSWLDDADVRVSAYWSIIAGAAGYTYGCNDIWQMYDVIKVPIINARTDWQAALQLPGSSQMGYMRRIFEKLSWQKMILNQNLILNNNPENESYILSAIRSDKKVVIAYTPIGNPIKIDLTKIDTRRIHAYWFNPRSGMTKHIGDFETNTPQEFKPWSTGWGSDFLLILTAENYKIDFNDLNK